LDASDPKVIESFKHQYKKNFGRSESSHPLFHSGFQAWLISNIDKYFALLSSQCSHVTLCHGDLTNNNLMLNERELFFIDWQTCFSGNLMLDLAFFLLYTTDMEDFEKETE
jgi:thiamine kinase-like enzyme